MMRNDYRRALILLRSNAAGYSGHVRLERRTLMGSMYFVVQAPEAAEDLQAVLVGRDRRGYYSCALGALRRDDRGQAVLRFSFDPRDICGRELEQYQLIAVVQGDCEIVLCGNVAGSVEMDWAQVRAVVCARSGAEREDRMEETEEAPQENEERVREVSPRARTDPGRRERRDEGTDREREEEEEWEEHCTEKDEAQTAATEDTAAAAQTALAALEVDVSLPWPEEIEGLRPLFRSQKVLMNAPDDGFVYISAPMPAGSGYAMCAAGVRAEGGVPVAVSYALPSLYAPEPPAGLEDAAWVGDNNSGWWVTRIDLRRGSAL